MVSDTIVSWTKSRIKSLFESVASWIDDKDVKYEKAGLWSVKKLLAIEWFIKPFYQIASKYFERWVYIDFFCGSGLMEVTSTSFSKKHTCAGSALSPLFLFSQYPFTEYYYFDKERANIDALNKRISRIPNVPAGKIHVEPLPFEESSRKLFGDTGSLNKNAMALVVIDPEGLDVKWALLENILRNGKVDVVLTIMTFALARNHSKALKNHSGAYAKSMTEFFGDDNWKNLRTSEQLITYYMGKIENLNYYTHRVKIERKGASVIYDVLFCSKNKNVGRILKDLEDTLKQITPRTLAGLVGTVQREYNDLTEFFEESQK
jgi:three-Cys-motif partner protein